MQEQIIPIGEIEEIQEIPETANGAVLTWRTKTLGVTPEIIYSPSDMSLTRAIETKDKKKNKQQFAAYKLTKPGEFKCEVPLNALVGVDVTAEIDDWLALMDGKGARLYAGGACVLNCEFILKEVAVKDYSVGTSGETYAASLSLTFAQSSVAGAEKAKTAKKKKKKKKKTGGGGTTAPKPTTKPGPYDGKTYSTWDLQSPVSRTTVTKPPPKLTNITR